MTVEELKLWLDGFPENEEIYISIDDNQIKALGIGYEKTVDGERILAIG